jgi:membrane-bound metal-dependent hydrolase YbcI (DUF457 family)
MTATAHALVGGAIAASVPDPLIGISLSLLSHPLLDMVPHWDAGWGWRKKTKVRLFTECSIDLLGGTFVAYLLFGQHTSLPYFLAAVFASELWDLLEIPYWFFNWRQAPFSWIYKFQHEIQGKLALPWGIVTQVVSVSAIVLLLKTI